MNSEMPQTAAGLVFQIMEDQNLRNIEFCRIINNPTEKHNLYYKEPKRENEHWATVRALNQENLELAKTLIRTETGEGTSFFSEIKQDGIIMKIFVAKDGHGVIYQNYFDIERFIITDTAERMLPLIEDLMIPIRESYHQIVSKPDSGEKFSTFTNLLNLIIIEVEKRAKMLQHRFQPN